MKLEWRYNLFLWLAFACIGLLVCASFVWQMQRQAEDEWTIIEGQVSKHQQALDLLLRSCVDEIESIRAVPLHADPQRSVWPQTAANGQQFSLDHVQSPDLWGNLVGRGDLSHSNRNRQDAVRRALSLSPWMSALAFKLPAVSEMRFLSMHGFLLLHPWRAAATVQAEDLQWIPPSGGPQRHWDAIEFHGQDRGLQAPLTAPVLEHDHIVALVRLFLSLDHLNRLNGGFGHALGRVLVVNESQQILADPLLYQDPLRVQVPPGLSQTGLGDWVVSHAQWPARTRISQGDWWAYRVPFRSAPWQLIYVVKKQAIWGQIWHQQFLILVEVLLGMLALMALAHVLTRREFVRPSLKLVQFIGLAARHEQTDVPSVPLAWRPWFERVRSMMQESKRLQSVEQELRIAAQMQQSILPTDWPEDEHHRLRGLMRAARHVGGDFFDHVQVRPGCLQLIVADVSGKGMGAALFGMVSKTHFRGQLGLDPDALPDQLLSGMNKALSESNPQCMFVTAVCARFDAQTGEFCWSGAGHPSPLLITADGNTQWLGDAQGIALGLDDRATFPLHRRVLLPGERVIWITDGLTEAIDEQQQEFGMQRLREVATRWAHAEDEQLIAELVRAVDEFVQGQDQFDDITCLVLTRKSQGAAWA